MESYGEGDANYIGDNDDRCKDCGAPLDDDGECPDEKCREDMANRDWDREHAGWGCSDSCGWCGRCS